MKQVLSIDSDIAFLNSFLFILQAYQEISAMRMNKIRGSVVETRDFIKSLSEIFSEVRQSYEKQIQELSKKKELKGENKVVRKAVILITANTRLYGSIINQVFEDFLTYIKNNNDDIIIIGNLGKELYDERKINKPYLFFSIPDVLVTIENLKSVVDAILKHDVIVVFHGRYESVIRQTPISTNITGNEIFGYQSAMAPQLKKRDYFFEPDLKTIVDFFKSQAVASLFKQTVHETHLARLASRINAMEEGLDAVYTQKNTLQVRRKNALRAQEQKQQQEQLAGINLWA